VIFDPTIDAKKVSLDADKDLVLASAVNFYGDDINEKEVEQFYAAKSNKGRGRATEPRPQQQARCAERMAS
jgi:hypothetical protein